MAGSLLFVIDDDHHFIFTLTRGVKVHQYFDQVQFFDDPEDGLAAIREWLSADRSLRLFLLLDIVLPKMDGWEVLEELRQLRRGTDTDIQLYVISSSVNPEDAVKAISYPEVRAFLPKPITRERIQEILDLAPPAGGN